MVVSAVLAAGRLTPDFEVIVINDGSRDATPLILDELARVYPAGARRAPPGQPRVRRRAAERVRERDEGVDLLHRRRRPVRPVGDGGALGAQGAGRRSGERLQDQPLRPVPPHPHRPRLPQHGEAAVRAEGPRRRLRFPPHAARDLRPRDAHEEQRRHLPGDDEEDPGRRLHDRRGPGAPLPPGVRQVAVLQLPAHRPDGRRRAEAVVGARRAPSARGRGPQSRPGA